MQDDGEPGLFPKTLDEILQFHCKEYSLPEYAGIYIRQILENKRPLSGLVCCHGGCEVCNDIIFQCYEKTLDTLKKENISFP